MPLNGPPGRANPKLKSKTPRLGVSNITDMDRQLRLFKGADGEGAYLAGYSPRSRAFTLISAASTSSMGVATPFMRAISNGTP